MNNLISQIKKAKKKKLFFWKENIFSFGERITSDELSALERSLNIRFPAKIKTLLIELAQGYANDLYIHGLKDIYPFDEQNGKIEGFVTFASDDMGNYYAFSPKSENENTIYYCCHDPLGYCVVAKDAEEFLNIFINSNYKITTYVAELDLVDIER